MKEKYRIELVERYDGKHYPKYIKLNEVYSTIEDAKMARNAWQDNNPNSNFFPMIMAISQHDLNADLSVLLK